MLSPLPELSATSRVPPSLAAGRYVAVLGGSNGFAPSVAANSRLSPGSPTRLIEAVRLLRMPHDAKLLLCGPTFGPVDSNATEMARTAAALGVVADRILKLEQPANTEEETEAIRSLVGDAPLALVSSAWHMPRAMALHGIRAQTPTLPHALHHAARRPLAVRRSVLGSGRPRTDHARPARTPQPLLELAGRDLPAHSAGRISHGQ